jgi:1,4-dihydroxy-6-naphthoate synthase
MTIDLGFSPCPNDTFIFDALVHNKIDTEGLDFKIHLEDVETLNQWALAGKLSLTKISYGVLPLLKNRYVLLDAGGALGKGVGPLLIARTQIPPDRVRDIKIAIPGVHTTAHMLFSLAFPAADHKKFMVFSEIEDAVLQGTVDAGVIIHENRFTYMLKGLQKLMDLGEFWENKTGCPIPLGAIVAGSRLEPELRNKISRLIRKSVEYGWASYPVLPEFVKQHASEMDEEVMHKHIHLYVNQYTLSLGEDGAKAVDTFLRLHEAMNKADLPAT